MTQIVRVLSRDDNEQLDRIFIRVKGGASLSAALERENCKAWYYDLPKAQRARITAQVLENSQRRLQTKDASFVYNLTAEQKGALKHFCKTKGVSVSEQVTALICKELSAAPGGLIS